MYIRKNDSIKIAWSPQPWIKITGGLKTKHKKVETRGNDGIAQLEGQLWWTTPQWEASNMTLTHNQKHTAYKSQKTSIQPIFWMNQEAKGPMSNHNS